MRECSKLKHRTRNEAVYFQIKTAIKIGDKRPFRVYQCSKCGKYHITFKPHFESNGKVKLILYRVKGRSMTREEHLKWCKARALEYVEQGDLQNAYASMASDLGKHPETEKHAGITLGMAMLMSGQLNTPQQMKEFIEGFN